MKYCAVLFVPPYQRIGTILVLSLLRTLLLYLFLFSLFHWVSCPDFFFFFFFHFLSPSFSVATDRTRTGLPTSPSFRPPPSAWLQKILCEILSASRYRPGIFYEMYNLAGCTAVSRNLPSFEPTRKRDFILKGINAFLRFLWYSMVHTMTEYIYIMEPRIINNLCNENFLLEELRILKKF